METINATFLSTSQLLFEQLIVVVRTLKVMPCFQIRYIDTLHGFGKRELDSQWYPQTTEHAPPRNTRPGMQYLQSALNIGTPACMTWSNAPRTSGWS